MANIGSRDDLINYCKRKLGEPVVKINVDKQQVEDRVDDALQYMANYHYDGIERYYLKYIIQSADITNGYIDINDPLVISVIRCFPIDSQTINMFDVRYQIHLNDFYNFNNVNMIHYDMAMQNLALMDFFFNTKKQFRFNRHQNRIHLDIDWTMDIQPGQFILFECYRALDPQTWTDLYNDQFLKEYTTELLREQWGENMKKYGEIRLPGGVILNGQKIYDEAIRNKERLETRVRTELTEPPFMIVG
jgi:hypothetical protein